MLTYIIIVAISIALGQTLSLVFMMKLMTSRWFAKMMAKSVYRMQNTVYDEMK